MDKEVEESVDALADQITLLRKELHLFKEEFIDLAKVLDRTGSKKFKELYQRVLLRHAARADMLGKPVTEKDLPYLFVEVGSK